MSANDFNLPLRNTTTCAQFNPVQNLQSQIHPEWIYWLACPTVLQVLTTTWLLFFLRFSALPFLCTHCPLPWCSQGQSFVAHSSQRLRRKTWQTAVLIELQFAAVSEQLLGQSDTLAAWCPMFKTLRTRRDVWKNMFCFEYVDCQVARLSLSSGMLKHVKTNPGCIMRPSSSHTVGCVGSKSVFCSLTLQSSPEEKSVGTTVRDCTDRVSPSNKGSLSWKRIGRSTSGWVGWLTPMRKQNMLKCSKNPKDLSAHETWDMQSTLCLVNLHLPFWEDFRRLSHSLSQV